MLQSAQATLASDTATLAQLRAASGRGAGEGGGRLPGEQRGREPSGRRRRGRRRLGIDAVRKRRADGGDRRAERDADCGQGHGRPEPGLVRPDAGSPPPRARLRRTSRPASVYGQSSAYTALPAVGKIVSRGQSLYSISGQPVVLLYGPVAAVAGVHARHVSRAATSAS